MRTACLALAVLLAGGCSGYRIVHDGTVQQGAAEALKRKLVTIRGLAFEKPVPVVAVSASEARGMLERELRREFSSDELATLSRVYAAFGLVPAGTDLERSFLDLYATQLAGFYDPIERRMVLVNEALATGAFTRFVESVIRRDLAGELVLGHELTHALQDQHFGLSTGRGDIGEDDAQLAQRAVYEGDATLAGYATVLGGLSGRDAASLAGKLDVLDEQMAHEYPTTPALIRESVVFQYVGGVHFVSRAYEKSGWKGVNALAGDPPRSTEQILHPEKYYVRREQPTRIQLGGLSEYRRGVWTLAEETTLGELTIRILIERFLGRTRADAVAAGWDGDRLLAVTHGDRVAFVWLTSWDTEQDAADFFGAWTGIVATRHPGNATTGADVVARGGNDPYYVERRGGRVLAIEGRLDDELSELAARVWRRSTFEPNVPWVPIDVATAR